MGGLCRMDIGSDHYPCGSRQDRANILVWPTLHSIMFCVGFSHNPIQILWDGRAYNTYTVYSVRTRRYCTSISQVNTEPMQRSFASKVLGKFLNVHMYKHVCFFPAESTTCHFQRMDTHIGWCKLPGCLHLLVCREAGHAANLDAVVRTKNIW